MEEGSSYTKENAPFRSKRKNKLGFLKDQSSSTEDQEKFQNSLKLPSEITKGEAFIQMPLVEKVAENDEECGKWVWCSRQNTALLDRVWIQLQFLLADGTLIMIKVSTAAMEHELGMVLCYTKPEKEDIKRAAKSIRDIIKDDNIMYYVVNHNTDFDDLCSHNNSKYMYTAKGRFYRRDHLERWILDEDCVPASQAACESVTQNICNLGPKELPSNASNHEKNLKHSTYFEEEGSTGCWGIMCDNSNKDACGWTEADRIWISSKLLYAEHTFSRIKYRRNAQGTFISCHVSSYSDVKSLLGCVKEVMENAQYANPVHFYTFPYFQKDALKYKYTAEGEFYQIIGTRKKNFKKFILEM